jgi:hypothetical protein
MEAGGREAGRENETNKETNVQYVTAGNYHISPINAKISKISYKSAINNSHSSQFTINPSHYIDICLLLIQIIFYY